jgi:glucose-1-phosphate thymidylyltransferase
LNLLGDGKEFGVRFSYAIQDQPRGLADAFIMGEDFIDSEPVAMILGDNIFEHNFVNEVAEFKSGGMIFVKDVSDPNRFGIAQVDKKGNVISIEEKPVKPKSNLAIVGFYVFDGQVAQVAKEIQPSERGELEITEIQKHYLHQKKLVCKKISGMWEDAGTFDSLLRVGNFMAQKTEKAI